MRWSVPSLLALGLAACGPATSPSAPDGNGPFGSRPMAFPSPEQPPPLSDEATTPVVTQLCWEIFGPSGGWCGDQPLFDDVTNYRCEVEDADGDGITLTLAFQSVDGCPSENHCWRESRSFEPRLTAVPVTLETVHVYPDSRGTRLTCEAVDARGKAARKSVCLGAC